MSMRKINEDEIISLLFYQGADLRKAGCILKDKTWAFYQVKNGYEVLNMLLFEGIDNEEVRLIEEGRKVNPILLDHIDELLKVYCNLFSAMCKYTLSKVEESTLHTYRYDRQQSLNVLKAGKTSSFFSNAAKRNTTDYFKQKSGLLILEVEASPNTLHLDINDVLGKKSGFFNEHEVLFHPYAKVRLKKEEMTEEELVYTDKDGKPPVGKYKVCFSTGYDTEVLIRDLAVRKTVKELLREKIEDIELVATARRIWDYFNNYQKYDDKCIEKYLYWKKILQAYIKIQYAEIYQDIIGEKSSAIPYY